MSRKHLLLGMVAAAVGVLSTNACSTGSREETRARTEPAKPVEMAEVRFLNSTTMPVDVYFGEQKTFAGVAPGNLAGSASLPAERHVFRVFPSGSTPDLRRIDAAAADAARQGSIAENSEGLGEGKRYLVMAVHKGNGIFGADKDKPKGQREITLRVDSDPGEAPDAGKAKVRVVHEAVSVDSVDIRQAGQKEDLWSGVDFNSTTTWKEVDPMKTTLEVRPENKRMAALKIPASFEAGKLYTYVITDVGEGSKLHTLSLVQVPAPAERRPAY